MIRNNRMSLCSFFLLSILLLLIMPTQILAKPQLTLKPNISTYTDFKVETYREALDEDIGIVKISKLKFLDQIDNSFAFGYHENNYWFHFFVSNDSVEARSMVLEFTEIIHKTLDLYEVSSDYIKHSKNGLRIPCRRTRYQRSYSLFSSKL